MKRPWVTVGPSYASAALNTGETFDHVFAAEGDFSYSCTIHPFMTGIVHLRKP